MSQSANEKRLPDMDNRLAGRIWRRKETRSMAYSPIAVDREKLTIMDVPFPDLETLESIAYAIGSNMFDGFQPTKKGIEIIRDYCLGQIELSPARDRRQGKTVRGLTADASPLPTSRLTPR
jgi:putative transcriptional regulator